jgi:energy-coupling factor transporter ATP-binding protein EcfA2
MSARPVIEVDELNVRFGEFHAVRDLSFQVERGELYALLGTNGAGKTSTLEVIEGRRTASAGLRQKPHGPAGASQDGDHAAGERVRSRPYRCRVGSAHPPARRTSGHCGEGARSRRPRPPGSLTTTVTTLAARQQNLLLRRIRSTAAGDATILTGLVHPVSVIATVQPPVILVVFASVGRAPANTVLMAAALASTLVMMLAFAIATARVTNSPEHAQVTALPLSLGVVGVASWVGITGTESLAPLKRILPGGSATELVVNAWCR